jgi:hypothetical protein
MSTVWVRRAAIAGLWIAMACSAAADGNDAGPPRSKLAESVARIYCDSLSDCCKGEEPPLDAARCLQTETDGLEQRLKRVVESAAIKYDAAAAARCLAQVEARATCGDGVFETFERCSGIFIGTVEELEGPCQLSAECKQVEGKRTTCQAPPGEPSFCLSETVYEASHSIEGGGCSRNCSNPETCSAEPGTNDVCFQSDGRFCTGHLPFGTCQPQSALGQACDFIDMAPCLAGTFCDGASSTCVAARAAGEACTYDAACQSGKCTVAQVCSATRLDPAVCHR